MKDYLRGLKIAAAEPFGSAADITRWL